MSRFGQKQMDKGLRRCIARLMHLHHQTHPDRLAERFNVTPQYVRRMYAEFPLTEQTMLREALKVFLEQPDVTLVTACSEAQTA